MRDKSKDVQLIDPLTRSCGPAGVYVGMKPRRKAPIGEGNLNFEDFLISCANLRLARMTARDLPLFFPILPWMLGLCMYEGWSLAHVLVLPLPTHRVTL